MGLMFVMTAGLFAADNVLTPQEKAGGWTLLFDGQTLSGWDSATAGGGGGRQGGGGGRQGGAPKQAAGPAQPGASVGSNPRACSTPLGQAPVQGGGSHWEVVDGLLVPCGDPPGYLTSKETYSNYVLALDFRAGEDANSGVFLRDAYEVQIWKAQPQGYNTGSIVNVAKTDGDIKFLADQWNHYEFTADGDHLVVVLNGTKTLDVHDAKSAGGHIRLQYQIYPIEFKNIKLKAIQH
jgi:hypothetical protein